MVFVIEFDVAMSSFKKLKNTWVTPQLAFVGLDPTYYRNYETIWNENKKRYYKNSTW